MIELVHWPVCLSALLARSLLLLSLSLRGKRGAQQCLFWSWSLCWFAIVMWSRWSLPSFDDMRGSSPCHPVLPRWQLAVLAKWVMSHVFTS